MKRIRVQPAAIVLAILILCLGCSSGDERWAEIAREGAREQAAQNERMAQLQREVAAGAKQLVEADAENRRELIALQTHLQAENAVIGRQRDQLDTDRKTLAAERQREPVIAAAILEVGALLTCLAPLVLCGYLLRPTAQHDQDEMVVELLVAELAGDKPRLLPRPTSPPLLTASDPAEQ